MLNHEIQTAKFAALTLAGCVATFPITTHAQVTVCHGQDNCQTVSPSGAVQWDEEEARQKTIREARDHAYSAMSACNLSDDPELCRDTALALIAALVRSVGN